MKEDNNDNPYDDSRQFNYYKWSDEPFLHELATDVWINVEGTQPPVSGNIVLKKYKVFKLFITDLFMLWKNGNHQYLGLPLGKTKYIKTKNSNESDVSYSRIKYVHNLLIKNELIDNIRGVYFDNIKRNTRIKPSEKLINYFNKYSDKSAKSLYDNDKEVLIIKEPRISKKIKAKKIDYVVDENMQVIKSDIEKYNKLLYKTTIDFDKRIHDDVKLKKYVKKIDLNMKQVTRVFNDGCLDYGGRYYGGWWTNSKSDVRKYIKINGKNTVEIDYKCLHIILLYANKNIDYYSGFSDDPYVVNNCDDPYHIAGFCYSDENRKFFKSLLLICLNSDNVNNAIGAIRKKINEKDVDKRIKLPADLDLTDGFIPAIRFAISAFKEKHKSISEYFFSGIGKKLQNVDSEIADSIINDLTYENIPVLCIHDSFICSHEHEDILKDKLVNYLQAHVNKQISVKLKKITID